MSSLKETIATDLSDIYTSLENKNATLPEVKNMDNVAESIDSIPSGSTEWKGSPDFLDMPKHTDGVSEIFMFYAGVFSALTLVISDLTGGSVFIDWTDGNVQEITANGNVTHTLDTDEMESYGEYGVQGWIRVYCDSGVSADVKHTGVNSLLFAIRGYGQLRYCNEYKHTFLEYINCDKLLLKAGQYYSTALKYLWSDNAELSGTNMQSMFSGCSLLQTIPLLDTSSVTNIQQMFFNCNSLQAIPLLNTSSVTNMNNTFANCTSLQTIPQLDTSSVTVMPQIFGGSLQLYDVPELNASSVINIANVFYYNFNANFALTNFGGWLNIGKAYSTSKASNFADYTITIGSGYGKCPNITHDSLMNVINKLYDLTTLDGYTSGWTQKLTLSAVQRAKLSEEEIAVATAKGWTVA